MSERTPKLLLEDILDSAEKIISYTKDLSYDDFVADSKTIDAVVWNFGIIGEATHRLPDSLKDSNIDINWHKMRGLRNRIVHDYFGISFKIIWDTKEDYLPELIVQVKKLIDNY